MTIDRLSHAYITDDSFADNLAMAVVCNARGGGRPCMSCSDCDKASRHIHPDIIEVKRLDNKSIISVDQIRELKRDVYIVPNDSMQKAYLVRDADFMNVNAQNALLQILEEPPAHAVFILSTDNPIALLPTVRSRCVELKAGQIGAPSDREASSEETMKLVGDYIEALSGNSVKLMECMFRLDKLDRIAFKSFLDDSRISIVNEIKKNASSGNDESNEALTNADSVLLKAGEMLDLNVSSGNIAGYVCASIIGGNNF